MGAARHKVDRPFSGLVCFTGVDVDADVQFKASTGHQGTRYIGISLMARALLGAPGSRGEWLLAVGHTGRRGQESRKPSCNFTAFISRLSVNEFNELIHQPQCLFPLWIRIML